jgi:hypothetical protein
LQPWTLLRKALIRAAKTSYIYGIAREKKQTELKKKIDKHPQSGSQTEVSPE